MRRRAEIALLALAACAHGAPAPRLVDLADVEPSIEVDMRYAGPDNFVGAPIDGYGAPRCLVTPEAARALAEVAGELRPRGLGLRVYDCYRPQRAVDHFARWAEDPADRRTQPDYYPEVPKSRLFEQGYIARRSSHSRGSTVDLTLVRHGEAGAGAPLDMGTPFDFFDPRSHTESPEVSPAARRNRGLLRDAMEGHGFANLPSEWWHYTLRGEPFPDAYGVRPIGPRTDAVH